MCTILNTVFEQDGDWQSEQNVKAIKINGGGGGSECFEYILILQM